MAGERDWKPGTTRQAEDVVAPQQSAGKLPRMKLGDQVGEASAPGVAQLRASPQIAGPHGWMVDALAASFDRGAPAAAQQLLAWVLARQQLFKDPTAALAAARELVSIARTGRDLLSQFERLAHISPFSVGPPPDASGLVAQGAMYLAWSLEEAEAAWDRLAEAVFRGSELGMREGAEVVNSRQEDFEKNVAAFSREFKQLRGGVQSAVRDYGG